MTREIIPEFQGRTNVTKITNDNNQVSYLTESVGFGAETLAKGASRLNTFESEKKHVLFLFNANLAEVGRYYMSAKLHNTTPAQLAEKKTSLVFFESWNAEKEEWIPCVSETSQEDLAETAIEF